MLAPEPSRQALTRLFQRQSVADLATLSSALKTSSRMSVFRRLSARDYLSSYSHAGRYYTLRDIPPFDQDGLWRIFLGVKDKGFYITVLICLG